MSVDALVKIIHEGSLDHWADRNAEALKHLFGSQSGRYRANAEKDVTLRAPAMSGDSGVPYAAYIHPSNPKSGPYSGLSFVIFPVERHACLVGLVVGTQGLSPDEAILGRPGHARKTQAICAWLNRKFGDGQRVAWAKLDPTRTDVKVPDDVRSDWPEYRHIFERYGGEIYAIFRPTAVQEATRSAVSCFLDVLLEERGHQPNAAARADAEALRSNWFDCLIPQATADDVAALLSNRRYVVIQGPPGTGKTKMATDLLRSHYGGHGRSIQFHPNTTYENFIGGLAPVHAQEGLGLSFKPTPGFLMQAAKAARENPGQQYLLHIDEINRADLGKILGEAIYLLEPMETWRRIELPYDFGPPFGSSLSLPKNLHILGTMNSADRSIALVDVALRRRFAFVPLWPSMSVVEEHGCSLMQDAFRRLVSHFVEHASEDAFQLMPGHSYFLEKDESRARNSLRVNLAPLLEEYLMQGYVGGFAEPIRSYLQWLRAR